MKVSILIALLVSFLLLDATSQNYIDLARISHGDGHNNLAVIYARSAWNEQPTTYCSYILACGFYMLNNLDSAVFYAGIALHDSEIHQDVYLTVTQRKNLNSIIEYYRKKHIQDKLDSITNRNENYSRNSKTTLIIKMSDETNTKNVMKLASRKEKENSKMILEEYIDIFEQTDTSDYIISAEKNYNFKGEKSPEYFSNYFMQMDGGNDEIIEISWIDSLNNQSHHSKYYDIYRYPELYEKSDFLVYPMIKIYINYINGVLDSTNHYVLRYELNLKNIKPFIKQICPIIVEKKDSLDILLKQYE